MGGGGGAGGKWESVKYIYMIGENKKRWRFTLKPGKYQNGESPRKISKLSQKSERIGFPNGRARNLNVSADLHNFVWLFCKTKLALLIFPKFYSQFHC